jgi:hypothetical protein
MTEATEITPAPSAPPAPAAAFANPAVARCCDARERVYKAQRAKSAGRVDAAHAYRSALPPLSGSESIRDFIACVAHGMFTGAIEGNDGSKLLYAAQVAFTAVRRQPASPKSAA